MPHSFASSLMDTSDVWHRQGNCYLLKVFLELRMGGGGGGDDDGDDDIKTI
jgi:hypothetical protein